MPLPSELIERLAEAGARRELGRLLDALAGAAAFKVERGVWTPAWSGLTVVGTPTYTGRYVHMGGQVVFFTVEITAGGAITTASTMGTTFVNNLPIAAAFFNACVARDMSAGSSFGVGGVNAKNVSTPTWGATNSNIIVSGWYATG